MVIVIGVGVVVAAIVALFASGYVKSPPDTAYIISGFRKPRILIGKAGFRIPFLERLDKLSLKMFSVDVKTTDFVPNAEYINVKVDATVKIRIGQSEEMMTLASKFFLNEGEDMIIRRVQDTLEGNMREIVGQMKLEEMVSHFPPTLVITAGQDSLAGETDVFKDTLVSAGVDVTIKRFEGVIHGFTITPPAKAKKQPKEYAASLEAWQMMIGFVNRNI